MVRLSRAALFALGTGGAALAAGNVTACSDDATDDPGMVDAAYGGPPTDDSAAPLYGAAPVDASTDVATDVATDAARDAGPDALNGAYGGPPPDGGRDADAGGPAVDAGNDTGIQPAYGGPPSDGG